MESSSGGEIPALLKSTSMPPKRRAVSRPMPPAAPVMTATFPLRRPAISVLLRGEVDVLYLGVIVERVRAELASDAGLLHPPKGGGDPDGGVGVDRDHPRLDAAGYTQGAGTVLGPDRTREAVDGVVGEPHGVILVLERDHRHDRTEDLLGRRPVFIVHRREDDGRIPEPGTLGRLAPDRHGRVLGDVGGDLLTVLGGDQGSHLRSLVERVPYSHPRDGRLHER